VRLRSGRLDEQPTFIASFVDKAGDKEILAGTLEIEN
jgi:hypothetical protein